MGNFVAGMLHVTGYIAQPTMSKHRLISKNQNCSTKRMTSTKLKQKSTNNTKNDCKVK